MISAEGLDAVSYSSAQDGIVAYTIDGYEGLTSETFTEEDFDRTSYESTVIEDQTYVSLGSPVYKLITDDDWSVIVQLDDETAEELSENETSTIKVRIDKDSETLNADFSLIQRGGKYYGCLEFNNSMIRYAEDRYLNIELILEDESGLKIPKTAVVTRNFSIVPREALSD